MVNRHTRPSAGLPKGGRDYERRKLVGFLRELRALQVTSLTPRERAVVIASHGRMYARVIAEQRQQRAVH